MMETDRRSGADTRSEIQRVALALFSAQGYAATSLRQIAERVGITKASLYYHFRSKDDIVLSVLAERGDEATALLEWVRAQPPAADLLDRAVLRWVDTFTAEKLQGIRFITANPAVLRSAPEAGGKRIGDGLAGVVELVAGADADSSRRLLVRMAFLSVNAAVAASVGAGFSDDDVVAAARSAARALLVQLRS